MPDKPEIAKQVLKDLRGLVVIDEFQRQPGLFPLLRVLADRPENPAQFLRDSGILHALLGLRDLTQVQSNPKLGGSWEGFALEQVIRLAGAERESYFYKTYAGAELDLLVMRGGKRYGFEFKYADAPGTSKSMHNVMTDLKLDRLWVVYPGEGRYPLTDIMEALPLTKCAAALKEENLLAD